MIVLLMIVLLKKEKSIIVFKQINLFTGSENATIKIFTDELQNFF